MFAPFLASHLEPFMTKLVHCDQTGFIKSRLASDNMRRLLHIIHAEKDIASQVLYLAWNLKKRLIGLNGITCGEYWKDLDGRQHLLNGSSYFIKTLRLLLLLMGLLSTYLT